jgi:hypothetical protein
MADRVLMITWKDPARGSETRAVEVFNEALGILGRRQQEGRIESFDVALMDPNEKLGGYMAIRGTREQISALRGDDEFRRNTIDATLCVDDVCHIEGSCNEGVAEDMAMYEQAVGQVPQRA